MATTEKQVENMLVRACKRLGIRCIKGESSSNKGYPDRIVYHRLRGEIYYVEVKNDTYYKQQVRQKEWQEHIEASGGLYFLVDGEDEMRKFIKEYIDV